MPETIPSAEMASIRDNPEATRRVGRMTAPADAMPLVTRAEAETGRTIFQNGSFPVGGGQCAGKCSPLYMCTIIAALTHSLIAIPVKISTAMRPRSAVCSKDSSAMVAPMRTICSVSSLAAALSTRFMPIMVDLRIFSTLVSKMHTSIMGMASTVRPSPSNSVPIQSRNPSRMVPAHRKKHKKVRAARYTSCRTAPARPWALHSADRRVHAIVTPESVAA